MLFDFESPCVNVLPNRNHVFYQEKHRVQHIEELINLEKLINQIATFLIFIHHKNKKLMIHLLIQKSDGFLFRTLSKEEMTL